MNFDAEGQLLNKGSIVYAFDFEHRLATIGTGTSAVQFKYDGAGNRLKAIRGSTETRYIYDASGNLLAEANSANVITKYYIYGAGLLQMVNASDSKNYCYHFNTIGSTIAMTDSAQAVVNKYAYTPFGAVTQTETVAQPFKYVGQFGVMQEPSGFYYMRARYYDPAVGRFISEDPIGFDGGDVNLYAYVEGNPVKYVDPNGETAIVGAIVGGAFGFASDLALQMTSNVLSGQPSLSSLNFKSAFVSAGFGAAAGSIGWGGITQAGKALNSMKEFHRASKAVKAREVAMAAGKHRNTEKTAIEIMKRNEALAETGIAVGKGTFFPAVRHESEKLFASEAHAGIFKGK